MLITVCYRPFVVVPIHYKETSDFWRDGDIIQWLQGLHFKSNYEVLTMLLKRVADSEWLLSHISMNVHIAP